MVGIQEDRSLGELFTDLSQDVRNLIRQEAQLAKVEMSHKASEAGRNVAMLAAGGFVAYAGFLLLLAAIVMGLALFMPAWLAALIVSVIAIGIGYFLVQKGISELKRIDPVPRRTVETMKENKEWVQQQAS